MFSGSNRRCHACRIRIGIPNEDNLMIDPGNSNLQNKTSNKVIKLVEKESSSRRWYSICPTLAKSDNFPNLFF